MTDEPAPSGAPAPAADRRSTRDEVAAALDLGWRVAALYALSPTTLKPLSPVTGDVLLNRRSLGAADRVELEVLAIAGVAERVGVPLDADGLRRLLALAAPAGASLADEKAFRDELARRHLAIAKTLWANDEFRGRAYELGNFLSDTWNRVVRPRLDPADPYGELLDLFGPVRVERMKLLLDDLQAALDPVAAHAVTSHLDTWRDRVVEGVQALRAVAAKPTPQEAVQGLEPIERQTIIWRQMLTGDKEPEAYIGPARRSEVRDEFTHELWKRYRRRLMWLAPLVAVLGAAVAVLYPGNEALVRGALGSALAFVGAFGITQASMISALRRGLQHWGDLLWNRSLAVVICRETSLVDKVFPPPKGSSA
ncbi:MAG: hypothetical protein QOJ35_3214 [Solirubrobacteraceae bacterium]|jgi:hypothetical protein|nr:hypothetical protein [Solirubrobacteraceae bacterium]